MTTLVLGIGNSLLSDDGAGIHAIHYLEQNYPSLPDAEFLDGGTLSFTLASTIERCEALIVVDATELHEPAGTVRVFVDEEMDQFLNAHHKRSVHEIGLIDLMNVTRLSEGMPARRALVGIQPEHVDWGEALSQSVSRAIPEAGRSVVALIEGWRQ